MKLTKNFSLKEFIESVFYSEDIQKQVWEDYSYNEDDLLPKIVKLASQLQTLRDEIEKPVHINISYRPVWYEMSKGRNGNSRHTKGEAADIRVEGMTPEEVKEVIERLIIEGEMLQGGLSAYPTFVHYDIGFNGRKRRW